MFLPINHMDNLYYTYSFFSIIPLESYGFLLPKGENVRICGTMGALIGMWLTV